MPSGGGVVDQDECLLQCFDVIDEAVIAWQRTRSK